MRKVVSEVTMILEASEDGEKRKTVAFRYVENGASQNLGFCKGWETEPPPRFSLFAFHALLFTTLAVLFIIIIYCYFYLNLKDVQIKKIPILNTNKLKQRKIK